MYRRGMKLGLLLSESRRHWATRPGRWRDSSRNCFTCWAGRGDQSGASRQSASVQALEHFSAPNPRASSSLLYPWSLLSVSPLVQPPGEAF